MSNVFTMIAMFRECKSIEVMPDISKWDTRKVEDMSEMFKDCIKLKEKPNIDNWEFNMPCKRDNIFDGCGFQDK